MIISHKHRFIFVEDKRVAGTSIEVALERICGEDDIITPINPKVDGHTPRNHEGFRNHMSAASIKSKVPREVWDTYFKFAFERNPWDKAVSKHWWMRAYKGLEEDFGVFCEQMHRGDRESASDFDRYTIDGKIAVDFIGRYEALEEDFAYVCRKLQLPVGGELPRVKANTRIDRKHYSAYYSERTRTLIGEISKNEIELLGYVFESR